MFFKIEYILNSQRKSIVIEAEDIVQASEKFEQMYDGVLIKITPTKEPLSHKIKKLLSSIDINKFREINLEEFVSILNQLYVMLDAGIPLLQSLENIQKSIKDSHLKHIFESVISEIKAGKSFSSAIEPFKDSLGIVTISMINLGEQTGQLAEAVKDLADILEQILDNRQRLKKATRYPIFIIVAMVIAFSIVILMVIPPFQSMFKQLNSELPAPTRFLLLIEHIIRDYGVYILSAGFVGFIILFFAYNKSDKIRLALDKFILKIYIVGDVIFLAMTGRFLFVFEKLVKAGIPINDALDTSIQIIENVYIKERVKLIKAAIADGRGLAQGFKDTKIFDNIVYQMVESGEQSGALSLMLSKASQYYLKKYRELIDNVSSMIEPILILAIAGFVLVLALGIFLPIWNLQSIAGK